MNKANRRSYIRIDVLPLQILSEDPRAVLFCEGLAMDLITDLSRFRLFRIVPWSTARSQHPDAPTDSPDLEALQLDYIVKGMARQQDEQLLFNIQLINVPENRLVWAEKFRGGFEEILRIQEDMVRSIVTSLQRFVEDDLLQEIRDKPLTRLDVYECWLRGYRELSAGTPESNEEARRYFRQALEMDPQYARACTGMSLSWFNEWSCQLWSRWEVSHNGAIEWARRAIERDPYDHISNAILGRTYVFSGAYEKAEHYLRESLRINDNDPETLLMAAFGFVYLGLLEEAEQLYQNARALRPSDRSFASSCGAFIRFERGDVDEALALWELHEPGKGWVDLSAFRAAAHFLRDEEDHMRSCWVEYLALFSARINGGRPADTRMALEWMINVNPYRGETRLRPFWEFIAETDPDELAAPPQRSPAAGSSPPSRFVREGGGWAVLYEGREAHVPDLKGCADIVRLLGRPNEEMHCTDLMGALAVESGAEVIDRRARSEYEQRIRALREEIEEAAAVPGSERHEKLQREYEQLLGHLQAALGIGGRTRTRSDTVEKCRSAVTWRIRSAIRKIEEVHPALGRHLEHSIHTGVFCTYTPEHSIDWIT